MIGNKIRTLLVDDDKNLLTSMFDILEFKGFEVFRFTKGKEALESINKQPVDVALIDLRLEDISGLDLLEEIKRRSPNTECILLTGYASQNSAIDAIRYGAFGYFQKPFDIDQVILSIQQAGQKCQAAEALAASEQRLRALIENGRDNIILLSIDGKVFWGSPSLSTVWGYQEQEIFGRDFLEVIHPDDKEMLSNSFAKLIKEPGVSSDQQYRMRRGDGEWRWVEATAVNLLEDPSVRGIVVNFRDITERKEINDHLWLQGSALEAAANAIVIADRDGVIISVNSAFETLTGYSSEEAVGKNPKFLNSGEQDEAFYAELWNTILNGKVWHSELVNKKRDGTKYIEEMTITPLVGEDGGIEYFIAIKQDISERRRIERILLNNEARYRSFFEESPVAIIEEDFSEVKTKLDQLQKKGVKDIRRYCKQHPNIIRELSGLVKITDANKAAIKIYGADGKEQLITNLSAYFTAESAFSFVETLVNLLVKKNNFNYETINQTFDGRQINIIIYLSIVPGHEEDLSKVLVSIIDISDLKKAEETLRKKNLLQDKVVALGRELASLLDISAIYQTSECYVKSMVDCTDFAIILYDSDRKVLTPSYLSIEGKKIDLSSFSPINYEINCPECGYSQAINSKSPVIVTNLAARAKNIVWTSTLEDRIRKSIIYIPILAEDQVMGLIELQSPSENTYSKELGDWLSVVANQIGLAIQNSRLHDGILLELAERKKTEEEVRQNLAELELLYNHALSVNQILDPEEIAQSMIKLFTKYFSSHHAVIRLRVRGTDDLHMVAFHVPGLPDLERERIKTRFSKRITKVGEGLSGWVIKTGQSIRVPDVDLDSRYTNLYPGIKSGVYVPISIGEEVLGVLAVESETLNAFSEHDERLLMTIANQAAVAFENAYLYSKVQKELEERRLTEEALRVSQERLQSILDNTNALIYIKDLEGRYTLVNNAMCQSFSLNEEDMVGKSAYELADRAEVDLYLSNDHKVLHAKEPATFEESHYVNGEKRTYISFKFPLWDEDGTISAIGGISTDITEQKKNEEQIQLLSYAIEQSPVGIVLTDLNGNIEYVNDWFVANLGESAEDCIGQYILTFAKDMLNTKELEKIERMIQRGEQWRGEYQNRRRNGELFWASISISPVMDNDHNMTHLLEIIEDVTARKEAELQLIQLNTELEDRVRQRTEELHTANLSLEKASKLKDEFLASMSHELRTPLTGVLGLSEALQKGIYGPLNDKQLNIIYTIEEGGRHLLNLINDILDLSKIEAGKTELQFSLADAADICQASLRMVKQIAVSRKQTVTYIQNPLDLLIYVDPRRVKQILVNLLGNAVKFTPEHGKLGLEVTGDKEKDLIYFTVWDNGIGIEEKNIGKLFQPFIQLDSSLSRSYTGTGLGLSLVKRLTELHGGQVSVTSEAGKGSRFTVSIPWRREKITEITTSAIKAGTLSGYAVPKSGIRPDLGTILLVDDNEINNAMLSDFLSFQGYKVITALDGKQGLEMVVRESPKIILMDIQMPEIDGLEVIRVIRNLPSERSKTPIIALTALAMDEDRQRCLDAGADDYISKPVNLMGLLSSIKKLLEEKS